MGPARGERGIDAIPMEGERVWRLHDGDHGSKSRPVRVRLGRVVSASKVAASIPIPDTIYT